MADNPIDADAIKAESMIRSQLASIERTIGNAPPTGKRLLTRKEKLLKSLAQPASTWTPEQGKFVLSTLLRMREGGKP
jgi:hypothetical protein